MSNYLVDAAVQTDEDTAITTCTQTEASYGASDHPLMFVEEGWFSTSMIHKILMMPHYQDFS